MRLKWRLVTIVLFISFAYPIENDVHSLTIKVEKLHNSKGVVQFVLYNKDGSIPDEKFKKYYRKQIETIGNNNTAISIFENLPTGRYAVNILHDENRNGKIDKGFILPIEGVGFSNFNKLGLLNRPNFVKSSFEFQSDSTLTVKMIYMLKKGK
jgi:uncharacterized protein (DUF2141 family)